ncbi:RagB/SusD family nutrient uptake outer membrane protein [Ilyomonas limi]|uniref:RagB/SusD family nutrient uptake outer membrane protein n=1 Tax=Ilyomonas limi TaxID=2575867 RepID=A0A4U3L5I3_9BACT|nr:RagB/SusD family nutrient uptake outer membrane protein [Ilyomonas limi]TKK70202.1 RagB/SusD family nutrient uptake outer membrane protein [Ilyomonas limi]
MKYYNYIKAAIFFLFIAYSISCTKLDQKLNSTLTNEEAANTFDASLFLQTAYYDLGYRYSDLGRVFALEEVPADETIVPTRGGDWDDNGKWRALHQHAWTADNVNTFNDEFNGLNKVQFDATNVLNFKPSAEQAAEARFIRAFALYQLLDLFGQFPYRDPGENLLNAPKVYSGDSAIQFIINELNAVIPDLDSKSPITKATPEAAKMLLMKVYLNRGAFLNRQSPTFDDADMQKVISLGNEIINSGKYSFSSNYWDIFSPHNSSNSEAIFATANSSGVSTNNTGISNYWWSTLHYNQYDVLAPAAGWNGFSTVAEFYNSFGTSTATTQTPKDTALDMRIGGRYYPGVTNVSGVRTGLLIGQQYDQDGNKYFDRKGNSLIFTPDVSPDLKETGNLLEDKGIRVIKYLPDYSLGSSSYNSAGNWLMLLRYSDVVLMVAEAKMRSAAPDDAGALALVNQLRAARDAQPLTSMVLVNPDNVYDAHTLLAERGRELYWESVRRTDLIRFGVFLKPWAYKSNDDAHFLLYPLPPAALASNPNLKQNEGYGQ